jgi:ribosomal protein L7/L12
MMRPEGLSGPVQPHHAGKKERTMAIFINADALAGITKLVVKDIGSANKIECIKGVREVTGLSLKQAKDLVEAALPGEDPVGRVARKICGE